MGYKTDGYEHLRDLETTQRAEHFLVMRARQLMLQRRDYKNLTAFSHVDLQSSCVANRTGHRMAPVAIFEQKNGKKAILPARELRRLYRMAVFDAKKEKKMDAPGAATAFLEIAQKPYTEMAAICRKPQRFSASIKLA